MWCIAIASAAILAQPQASAAQAPPAESTIAYRLVEPKTMHFEDPQKYAAHTDQVQKLGCEVAKNEHAGHGDVTYRCPKVEVVDGGIRRARSSMGRLAQRGWI